jgi:hypothetical protein
MLLETHFYDGKLFERKVEISESLKKAESITLEDKKVYFLFLRNKIQNCIPDFNFTLFDALVNSPAYDPSNQFRADNLLYLCYELSCIQEIEKDIIDLVCLQFQDMQTGFCSQGQTTRLFQIIIPFANFLKNEMRSNKLGS